MYREYCTGCDGPELCLDIRFRLFVILVLLGGDSLFVLEVVEFKGKFQGGRQMYEMDTKTGS